MPSPCYLVQGIAWSYSQLAKDLCDLHDPEQVAPLLNKCLDEHDRHSASEGRQRTLQSLHEQCIACFAEWLQAQYTKFPVADFLAVTGRTAAVLASVRQLPALLANADLREQAAVRILSAAGLLPNSCNKQVPAHQWVRVVASPQKAGHSSTPPEETCAAAKRLVSSVTCQLSSNESAQAMWVAAVKESAESITAQLSQAFADPSMSPALWRLLAIQCPARHLCSRQPILDNQLLQLSDWSSCHQLQNRH